MNALYAETASMSRYRHPEPLIVHHVVTTLLLGILRLRWDFHLAILLRLQNSQKVDLSTVKKQTI